MNNPSSELNAMVLAAGLGTRMRPLTETLPKPLLPICNRPLIEVIFSRLTSVGVGRIAVNTHYQGEKLADWIAASPWSGRVALYPEENILGTGGPLVNAAKLLGTGDCFILHNGDILCDVDLAGMVAQHRRNRAAATLLTLSGPENRVRVLSDGTISDILGRLGADEQAGELLTYGGIMVLSPEVMAFLPPEPVNCSIIPAVLELIRTSPGRVQAWRQEGIYWNDLGTIERYFSAHRDLLNGSGAGFFERPPERRLIAEGAEISPDALLQGFICAVADCRVEAGATLENCVLLDGARVGENDFFINSVIGRDFVVHRDFSRLAGMKILAGRDLSSCRISSLREYGSARGFFRIGKGHSSQVLMVSDSSDADFNRFVDLGAFFFRQGLPTPEIYAFEREEYSVLMEDLGNEMLYTRRIRMGNNEVRLEALYRQVIDALVLFQLEGTVALHSGTVPEIRLFDLQYLRWESRYFQENFLFRLAGIPEEGVRRLDDELEHLAAAADGLVKILMHRDFQSQNIMIWREAVRLVDFQGARIGPAGYDVMSLLRDPYVEVASELRIGLMTYYFQTMARHGAEQFGLNEAELRRSVVLSGLQRIMQALGAYGFLALSRGKMQYLQYVPRAMGYLEEAMQWLDDMPEAGVALKELKQLWPAVVDGWERRRYE